jgi:hypothetical protein
MSKPSDECSTFLVEAFCFLDRAAAACSPEMGGNLVHMTDARDRGAVS